MAKILVVYGTVYGQTEKIARAICLALVERGHAFEMFSGSMAPRGQLLNDYDGVIVGSSLHFGRYNKAVINWLSDQEAWLMGKPSAFFSVCMAVLDQSAGSQSAQRKIVEKLYRDTNWHPELDATFAGALAYSKYGWFKRMMMRAISKRSGRDTDTSRDYEYTNWKDVTAFTQRYCDWLEMKKVTRAQASA